MKTYAQHGYGDGQKTSLGLENDYIDGVIFSPRDISISKLEEKLNDYKKYERKDFLFDSQFYVSLLKNHPKLNLSKLAEYFDSYFQFKTKIQLESDNQVNETIKRVIDFQENLPTTGIIAPNILISRSFDSIEGAISRNFIRNAKNNYNGSKPLYCTLCISAESLMNLNELQEFLSIITLLDNPPDGFYILVSLSQSTLSNEFFNSDLIANWMLLNYSLTLNGFEVINGYSDILSPTLVIAGADAVSTGWWSNLRRFSIEKFTPIQQEGGSLPIIRYYSKALFKRIRFDELAALKEKFPEVLNNLETDNFYLSRDDNSELNRTEEILQSWETLKKLSNTYDENISLEDKIQKLSEDLDEAHDLFTKINYFYNLNRKSREYHIEPMLNGITKFKKIAEI
ncbi:MAG: hypothetical protein PVH88_07450 [Ignavibacteria bacterium]|jgi:hypothetical protein